MEDTQLSEILYELTSINKETERVEFKMNKMNPDDVGRWISALSNGSCLIEKTFGYLVFGVRDSDKEILGVKEFLKEQKKGNEEIEHWILQRLIFT